jgi:hypothetical protein
MEKQTLNKAIAALILSATLLPVHATIYPYRESQWKKDQRAADEKKAKQKKKDQWEKYCMDLHKVKDEGYDFCIKIGGYK